MVNSAPHISLGPFRMPGVQIILSVSSLVNDLPVIITRLVIPSVQERAPGDRTPCLRVPARQVIYLKEIFQGLVVMAQVQMTMADTDLYRQVVGRQHLITMVIGKRLLRPFQCPIACSDPADHPFAVRMDQVGLQVSRQSLFDIPAHLLAKADLLRQRPILRIAFRQVLIDLQCLGIIFLAQIKLGNRRQALPIVNVGTQDRQIVEIKR